MNQTDDAEGQVTEKSALSDEESSPSAILISRDAKTDFTYHPDNPSGVKGKSAQKIRLTRPELQEEFFHATGSEEFYVISLDLLIEHLIAQNNAALNVGKERYGELIKAYQNSVSQSGPALAEASHERDTAPEAEVEVEVESSLATADRIGNDHTSGSDDVATDTTVGEEDHGASTEPMEDGEDDATPAGSVNELNSAETAPASDERNSSTGHQPVQRRVNRRTSLENVKTAEQSSAEHDKYEKEAYADSTYAGKAADQRVLQCIGQLKSYNWYEQNRGVEALQTLSRTPPEDNRENRTALFVAGRNLVQSAQGNAYSAISFLTYLKEQTINWPFWMVSAVIDGCFFEEFFDSHGVLRAGSFKAKYHEELLHSVLEVQKHHHNPGGDKALSDPLSFISAVLSKRRERPECRFLPDLKNENEQYRFTLAPAPAAGDDESSATLGESAAARRTTERLNTLRSRIQQHFALALRLRINNTQALAAIDNAPGMYVIRRDLTDKKSALGRYFALPQDRIELADEVNEIKTLPLP